MFEKDIFTNTIKSMTKEDGSDLNCRIQELFEFLDTKIRPEDTPAWLRKFPYVNGQLFTEQHTNVVFSTMYHTTLQISQQPLNQLDFLFRNQLFQCRSKPRKIQSFLVTS